MRSLSPEYPSSDRAVFFSGPPPFSGPATLARFDLDEALEGTKGVPRNGGRKSQLV